jgi:hypothetical protein
MTLDPIVTSVIRHRLHAIVEEMGEAMLRTAYSQILNSSRDFSCAICDLDGRLIAQAEHVPIHVGALPYAARAVSEFFQGDIHPGDMFLLARPVDRRPGHRRIRHDHDPAAPARAGRHDAARLARHCAAGGIPSLTWTGVCFGTCRFAHAGDSVIASGAKQSRATRAAAAAPGLLRRPCGAPRNDGYAVTSLRAERSNPGQHPPPPRLLDCFVALAGLLAMTATPSLLE